MSNYDYLISVDILNPPIGDIKYVAKIAYFYEKADNGEKPISPRIPEAWGKTKEEAYAKMKSRIDDWIASRE